MSAITVGGDLVHYEKLGRGKPVILLHGWIGSWRYWIPLMRQLQLKYAVYAIDMFGYGDSGKNPVRYSVAQQVDMMEIFMKELVIPKAAFIAHGMGAMMLVAFANRHPEKVARALLVSSPLFDPGDLKTRTPSGHQVRLLPTSPDDIKKLEASQNQSPPEGGAEATIARRPAGLDFEIGRAGAPPADPTVSSASQDTIVNPSKVIDREKLRQAAMARGAAAMSSGDGQPPRPQQPAHNPLKDIMEQSGETLLNKCFKRSDADYEKLQSVVTKMDDRAIRMSAEYYDSGTMLDAVRQMQMPAVLVHGEDDPIIPNPGEEVWNYLTLDKDDSILPVPLPGVRHFPMLEYEPFARLVGGFLETPDISKLEIRERWRRRTR